MGLDIIGAEKSKLGSDQIGVGPCFFIYYQIVQIGVGPCFFIYYQIVKVMFCSFLSLKWGF